MEKKDLKELKLEVEELMLVAGGAVPNPSVPATWPTTAGSPSGPGIGPNIPPGWPSTNLPSSYLKTSNKKTYKKK
jgi:hypothetical protein